MTTQVETWPRVVAVSRDGSHRFSKPVVEEIVLVEGLGVEGDAHSGRTVQHRSRVARDPSQPNLRQVHLISSELFDEVAGAGYQVSPGQLGENVTTRGIDLLGLPTGTVVRLGNDAVVLVTGLRNPCRQINEFEPRLLREIVVRTDDGRLERKGGIMAVVTVGGAVHAGDRVWVEYPDGDPLPLSPV